MSSDERRSIDRRRRGQRGTTLIEALAATALIAVGVMGLSANGVSLVRASKTADSVAVATALAQEQLERLRSLPLGAAQLAPGNYTDADNPIQADGTDGGTFTRAWTVSVNDSPSFGLKTVTVRVTWTDSRPHETRVAAYVRCAKVPC